MKKAPKILVVEDSRSIRTYLGLLLKKIGAHVDYAANGQEGLNKARQEKFDLVLSDVDMPVMNGLDFCRALKLNRSTRSIPFILLSSMESEQDIDNGFEAGASAYVTKSSSNELFIETIEETLQKSSFKQNHLILVVDDSVTVLRLIEAGLERAGFNVATAKNGKEALLQLKKERPDLIISDLDMPVMNGMQFKNEIKTHPEWSGIPFMVMSANSDRSTMRNMISMGIAAYLIKPFNMEQLVLTAEKLLSDQFQLLLKDRERLNLERDYMLASITSLAQALEARDAYTRGHSDNVSMIVANMAKYMGMEQKDIEELTIGARLHDIGKIGIPDNLLLKAGPLTKTEILKFQKHPTIGAGILQPVPSFSKIIPVVLHHHERIDGKGYPGKLKGNDIPLWARMTAVADTYDALTTNRPYRKGFKKEIAFQIIDDAKGTQLCGECVEIFFNCFM